MRIVKVAIAGFLLSGIPGWVIAQSEDSSEQPVFKRIAAPKPGSAPKITVQIDPDDYFAYFNPEPLPEDTPVLTGRDSALTIGLPYDLFWREFVAAGQPRNLDAIASAMAKDPAEPPKLAALRAITGNYGGDIMVATIGTRVSPALALAVIWAESGGDAVAQSSAGAQGLMQLIPATADRFNVADAMRPDQDIKGGIAYLDWLMEEFAGNPVHVLAAYNAGENAVIRHNGAPPFAETREYVPKVLAAWNVARTLCITPPEMISDGCVFLSGEVTGEG